MKKISLIIGITILMSFFLISSLCCSLENNTSLIESQEISQVATCELQLSIGMQIISPADDEIIKGSVKIQWIFSTPYSQAEFIESKIYYKNNLESNWIRLGDDTYETFFVWNTVENIEYGIEFKIKITANSKEWEGGIFAISENSFTIDNRNNPIELSSVYFLASIPMLIILLFSIVGSVVYHLKNQEQFSISLHKSEKNNPPIIVKQETEFDSDNVKATEKWSSKNLLSTEFLYSSEYESITQFFSNEIQKELKSEIKGRTILVLLELAYQNPSETNPVKIAEKLDIPLSTLSKEIKKLTAMQYIEPHISKLVLLDARFRNYKLTEKGFEFLNTLNYALNKIITHVQ